MSFLKEWNEDCISCAVTMKEVMLCRCSYRYWWCVYGGFISHVSINRDLPGVDQHKSL
jgi:hypothetical protein